MSLKIKKFKIFIQMQMVNTVKDGKIDSSLQQSMVALMKYAKNLSAKFFFFAKDDAKRSFLNS